MIEELQRQKAEKKLAVIREPVEITFCFYRKTRRRVDLSNLEKAIEDALVKAKILEDDSLIIAKHSYLYKGAETPRIVIEIKPCEKFLPIYQP